MIEIGRLCVKIAGRDSGKTGVVIDVLDDNYVLLDGEVRRRKCNIFHLEPLEKHIDIAKNASHKEVMKALSLEEKKKKTEKKEKTLRPKRIRTKKTYTEPKKEKKVLEKTKKEKIPSQKGKNK